MVSIINQRSCAKSYADIHDITDRMICARGKYLGNAICRGNEGGPLACFTNGFKLTDDLARLVPKLAGIVSWSEGCDETQYPKVFSRVHAVRLWILNNTGI